MPLAPIPVAVVQGRVATAPVHPGDNAPAAPHAEGGSGHAHAATQTSTTESTKSASSLGQTTAPSRHPSTVAGETLKNAIR